MELYNGSVRTVTYFGSGQSQADQDKMNETQRAENTAAREQELAAQVQRLGREYVSDEIKTERYRQAAQEMMYCYAAGFAPLYTAYVPFTLYSDYLTPSRYYNYGGPVYGGFPYTNGFAGAPLWSAAYQRSFLGLGAATHEGPFKTDFAAALASPGMRPEKNK
jgi:hypothetical protein